jgi:hypothetical protein
VLLSVIWIGKSICASYIFWWRTTYEPRIGGTHYTIVPNTSLQFFQLFNYFLKNAFQLQLYSSDGNNYMLKDMLLVITQAPDTLVNYTKQRGVGNHEMTEE